MLVLPRHRPSPDHRANEFVLFFECHIWWLQMLILKNVPPVFFVPIFSWFNCWCPQVSSRIFWCLFFAETVFAFFRCVKCARKCNISKKTRGIFWGDIRKVSRSGGCPACVKNHPHQRLISDLSRCGMGRNGLVRRWGAYISIYI